jgi:hypothetical protein
MVIFKMITKYLNTAAIEHFLPGYRNVTTLWQRKHLRELMSERGWSFVLHHSPTKLEGYEDPKYTPERSSTRVVVCNVSKDDSDAIGPRDVNFEYHVPTKFLKSTPEKYCLYNVRFAVSPHCKMFDQDTARFLQVGYYGVTGRHPFERFKEHHRDMVTGKGHLLHKAWRSLRDMGVDFYAVFQICASASSLDDIYAIEEKIVAENSLSPLGLNVIPGGHAGIRFARELGLLNGLKTVDPDQRDKALCDIENEQKATFYRSGHFRKLSETRTTWVRPHWVNLPEGVAA